MTSRRNDRARELWTFNGGLHLPGNKHMSTRLPVEAAPLPRELVLPLQQHIGEPAVPLLAVGDKVLKGQPIAAAEAYVSVPLHASSSGTVTAIEKRPIGHPSGLSAMCMVIETDGEDRWIDHQGIADYHELDVSGLRNRVREAGIVGLGGAGFPSFIKLNAGPRKQVDVLILNGAECEPSITCDDMLMREHAATILRGMTIMRHILDARAMLIGIEDNKPEALAAMIDAANAYEDIEIAEIPTIYPTGSEKQLIKVLTGREVPSHGLPLDIGVVCHNVGTAAAVARLFEHGEPLVSRYVTITGDGVETPRNLDVRIGTPVGELIEYCGGNPDTIGRTVIGGPMMGFSLHDLAAPVVKTSNCILTYSRAGVPESRPAMPCIRCGECARACPVNLLPQQLYWYAHARDFDKAQDYKLFDCIECGCCSYVCPSHIPLVHYYRYAKSEIGQRERDKEKSDLARTRHEFREFRLAREKQERAERMNKKKKALADKPGGKNAGEDAKKAAIAAALERVKQKKAAAAGGSETGAGESREESK